MPRKLTQTAAIVLCAWSMHALGFLGAANVEVVEYKDAANNRYFLTSDIREIAGLDAAPGSGWKRTGISFYAYDKPTDNCNGCVPVSRFYRTTHFFTAFGWEADLLKRQPEWSYEGVAFVALEVLPGGNCYNAWPVRRFAYPNGAHRYVIRDSEEVEMRRAGWINEGLAFCIPVLTGPDLLQYRPDVLQYVWMTYQAEGSLFPGNGCDAIASDGCVSLKNLSMPLTPGVYSSGDWLQFASISGLPMTTANRIYLDGPSASDAAQRAFVQFGYSPSTTTLGLHVDTHSKTAGAESSAVTSLHKLPYDPKVPPPPITYPWLSSRPTQLAIIVDMMVKRVTTRSAGSQAHGHTGIEFVDMRSGGRILFNMLAYATQFSSDQRELAWWDDVTGKTIVGAPFRAGSPYGRNAGATTMLTPSGYVDPGLYDFLPPAHVGTILHFEFDIDRDEFARVLQSARTVDGSLSPDPADYRIDNFLFRNEVAGDGEIGATLGFYSLQLKPR